ncbi:UNVERIFIED_CONTAM: hypothetical protein K2H54_017484 [Gekko kuhli]
MPLSKASNRWVAGRVDGPSAGSGCDSSFVGDMRDIIPSSHWPAKGTGSPMPTCSGLRSRADEDGCPSGSALCHLPWRVTCMGNKGCHGPSRSWDATMGRHGQWVAMGSATMACLVGVHGGSWNSFRRRFPVLRRGPGPLGTLCGPIAVPAEHDGPVVAWRDGRMRMVAHSLDRIPRNGGGRDIAGTGHTTE